MFGLTLSAIGDAIGPRLGSLLAAADPAAPVGISAAAISPMIILILCVVAGIGTVLLLPGRREGAVRKVGGVIVLGALLVFGAVLGRGVTMVAGGRVGIYFWIFAFIALAAAARVVTHPRPVYAALYFVLTVFASAGLFILLWAEFMAAALILIYAGAILVTYVFVIMLAAQAGTPERAATVVTDYDRVSREPVVAAAVGFALMGMLLYVTFDRAEGLAAPRGITDAAEIKLIADPPTVGGPGLDQPIDLPYRGSTQQLGLFLFKNHLLNLELAGLILTIATIGAIVIARRRVITTGGGPAMRTEVLSTPATPINDDPFSIPVYGTDNPRQKAYPEA